MDLDPSDFDNPISVPDAACARAPVGLFFPTGDEFPGTLFDERQEEIRDRYCTVCPSVSECRALFDHYYEGRKDPGGVWFGSTEKERRQAKNDSD